MDSSGSSHYKSALGFVFFGTPFQEKKKLTHNTFLPIWKQEAKNEAGAKRFHGAFTGGFSAGFQNTVGSAEGWKPSTFHSSRAKKAAQICTNVKDSYKIEDFMDKEDLTDLHSLDRSFCHKLPDSCPEAKNKHQLLKRGREILFKLDKSYFDRCSSETCLLFESLLKENEMLSNRAKIRRTGLENKITSESDDDSDTQVVYFGVKEDFDEQNRLRTSCVSFEKACVLPESNDLDFAPLQFVKDDSEFSSLETDYATFAQNLVVPEDFEEVRQAQNIRSIDGANNFCIDPSSKPTTTLDREKAQKALEYSVFVPFKLDVEKQNRYVAFLKGCLDGAFTFSFLRPNELEEFIQTATIFRPLHYSLENRFVSISRLSSNENTESKQVQFSQILRKKSSWLPTKLLCKRFENENHLAIACIDTFAPTNTPHSTCKQTQNLPDNGNLNTAAFTMIPPENPELPSIPPLDLFQSIFGDKQEEDLSTKNIVSCEKFSHDFKSRLLAATNAHEFESSDEIQIKSFETIKPVLSTSSVGGSIESQEKISRKKRNFASDFW